MGFLDISDLFSDPRHMRTLKTVLLVGALYPFYLLTCYMAAKGFYAYEMFSSIAGLVVPVLFMALVFIPVLLVFSLLCWGSLLVLLDSWLTDTPAESDSATPFAPRRPGTAVREAIGVLPINAGLLAALLWSVYTKGGEGVTRPVLALVFGSLAVGVVLVIGPHIPAGRRATAYGLLLLAALIAPLVGGRYTTSLIEAILTQFRLGGVMVTLAPSDQSLEGTPAALLHGRLVFLSASNLYLETGCPRKLIIIPRRDSLRLEFAEIRTAGLKEFQCPGAPQPQGEGRR